MSKSLFLLFLAVISYCATIQAQFSVINSTLGISANVLSRDHVPFWLRSNQYGNIPPPGNSISLYGSFRKEYDTIENPLIDWGGSLEVRADIGNQSDGIRGTVIEGYLKMGISIFQIKAGRDKQVVGIFDTALSSGSFAMSGNALGIPKVEISIPNYYTLPFFDELFAIKGNFAFGWLGPTPVQTNNKGVYNELFQQTSFYGRFGKPDWSVHLFGGFNHQVQFGNEQLIFGSKYKLDGWQTFLHAAMGKTYQGSKVGNHIGSIDLGAEIFFNTFSVLLYRQSFYDEGALIHLANIADGLNGISITNNGEKNSLITWNKVLFEFFYSLNQAGYPWSKPTASGDENYYNNYEFENGYSYKTAGIGSPLVSAAHDTRPFPNYIRDYFNNNRVSAIHIGLDASISDINVIAKGTFSKNYGTFSTSPYGSSTGSHRANPVGIFPESNQMSFYLDIQKPLQNGYLANVTLALDQGDLLYNTSGIIIKLTKRF